MKNPTLLTLLKMGCTIQFPSGYKLHGDAVDGYIEISHEFGPDGLRILGRDGVAEALQDAKKYEKEQKEGI